MLLLKQRRSIAFGSVTNSNFSMSTLSPERQQLPGKITAKDNLGMLHCKTAAWYCSLKCHLLKLQTPP